MDIRNVLDTFSNLTEDRKKGLQYTEEKVKKVLDRVIVELKGTDSMVATRLAQEYQKVKEASDLLKAEEKSLKEDASEYLLDYFDASDAALTRVIQTASLTLTMSKAFVRSDTNFDLDNFYTDIIRLLPKSKTIIDSLVKKYKTVSETDVKPRISINIPEPVNVKVKHTRKGMKESAEQPGFMDHIKAFGAKFLAYVQNWGQQYDKQLQAIEQKYAPPKDINHAPAYRDQNPDLTNVAESNEFSFSNWKKLNEEEFGGFQGMDALKRKAAMYHEDVTDKTGEIRFFLRQYLEVAKAIDGQSGNASQDRMMERKIHSVMMQIESAESNLNKLSHFIQGLK